MRDEVHADVTERGYSEVKSSFTQAYDSDVLDACALLIPRVGFLPYEAPSKRYTNNKRTPTKISMQARIALRGLAGM